ncbi:hypothetical protein CANTEDRAFT_115539 [Yamadazyma tenuis ATCC 10573]|uniref:Uncharacterized protein n=1 Tax=Candida tenuis (strain ATCC 10573 / BCRC 21748 / CBS 615 / JCM 9827 / NBRC 10315 / NRRL Y-1498 / VKM Y-70) TaxID=590646 RepID=G3BAR2_CANTC|nr:uncharacterized protein CANTEDRAFT_115539 [Yamadazyma tenuis ATCC 10573]EGV62088.1 hypothetical protein CANTEDRAFT_115539 [Yamadazyma tenuis ATCC 10573]
MRSKKIVFTGIGGYANMRLYSLTTNQSIELVSRPKSYGHTEHSGVRVYKTFYSSL